MDVPTSTPRPGSRSRLAALVHPHVFVALLIAATLYARAGELDTPIGRVRPTMTAMVTRNLSRDFDELGPRALLYPRIDFAGDQPGYLLQDFPLVNLAGVGLLRAFDLSWETALRLPSLLLFALMLAFLYAFVRRRFGTPEALAAVLIASFLPVSVYASMEVMPEQGVATAFVAGLYFFDRHLDRGERRPLVLAALALGAMLLVKATSGLLFLSLIGLYRMRRGTLRGLFAPRYLVTAALTGLPLVSWLIHAAPVNRASVIDEGSSMAALLDDYLNQRDRWIQLGSGQTYAGMWRMLVTAHTTAGMVLFLAGYAAALAGLAQGRVLVAWGLASMVAYMGFLPHHTSTHWYYTHAYVPVLAIGGSLAAGLVVRKAVELVPTRAGVALELLGAATALVLVLRAVWEFEPPYRQATHAFGQVLQELFEPRTLGIIASDTTGPWDAQTHWSGDVRGWRACAQRGPSPWPLSEEFIEERRRKGARFLAHIGPSRALRECIPAWVRRKTAEGKLLASTPEWSVFSLD